MVKNQDFGIYNNFSAAILILDSENKIAFKNLQFIRNFGNIKNLDKFSKYFSFDICVLDSDNLLNANPVNFAIESKESFSANATYQRTKDLLYYLITAFYSNEYKVLIFKNITTEILYHETEKRYSFIRQQYLNVIEENKHYESLQQSAQAQTVKLALLQRISNVMRESMDVASILNSTLKELYNLFGAIKVYYAKAQGANFIATDVFPAKFEYLIGQKAEFSSEIKKAIGAQQIKLSSSIKDCLDKEYTYPAPVNTIVVPVSKQREILGVLVIYTNQKLFEESQNDVLQSISTQLASEIVQASLYEQVKEKNQELETTLTELKETQLQLINSEKMASLGQLVAGVAHEINTPLGSINANNDILDKLIKRLSSVCEDTFVVESIENINKIDKEAIKRISGIVQGLKRFVRLDESELQLADINNELDLTLELIKHETKNRIEILKNYNKIPQIKCYPNMLNQVFMNILINACQSIENKGTITVSTEFKDDNLTVKIKDTGCGIDDNIKNKMFMAGTTTKKIGIGTGLGLAISQKIMEKHNGKIGFNSEKGVGTEFIITLPTNI